MDYRIANMYIRELPNYIQGLIHGALKDMDGMTDDNIEIAMSGKVGDIDYLFDEFEV